MDGVAAGRTIGYQQAVHQREAAVQQIHRASVRVARVTKSRTRAPISPGCGIAIECGGPDAQGTRVCKDRAAKAVASGIEGGTATRSRVVLEVATVDCECAGLSAHRATRGGAAVGACRLFITPLDRIAAELTASKSDVAVEIDVEGASASARNVKIHVLRAVTNEVAQLQRRAASATVHRPGEAARVVVADEVAGAEERCRSISNVCAYAVGVEVAVPESRCGRSANHDALPVCGEGTLREFGAGVGNVGGFDVAVGK